MSIDIDDLYNRLGLRLKLSVDTSGDILESRINQFIEAGRLSGLTDEQIYNLLLDDLRQGGRIFGEFKKSVESMFGNLIASTSDIAGYEEIQKYTSGDKWKWITTEGDTVCIDCRPRHGQVETYETWRLIGLPRSGWSICRDNCQCQLVPESIEINEVVKR